MPLVLLALLLGLCDRLLLEIFVVLHFLVFAVSGLASFFLLLFFVLFDHLVRMMCSAWLSVRK